MATWRRANFTEILLAVRAYLVSETGLDDTRVFVSALGADDVPRFSATQDLILRPQGEEPLAGIVDGSGRYDRRTRRSFEAIVRTRVLLDQSGRDSVRLTDASLGHLALEDAVVDALELYHLADSAGDALAAPLRVGRLTGPQRLRDDRTWVWSAFTVEVEHRRDLDIANGRL